MFEFQQWKKEILQSSNRNDEEQECTFLRLVDQVEDHCNYETAKVLMKTFSDKPDYGTQERVISILCNLSREEFIQVILEELPRLFDEAYEWAEILIGLEIQKRFSILQEIIKSQPKEIKNILRLLISNDDFLQSYPKASILKI